LEKLFKRLSLACKILLHEQKIWGSVSFAIPQYRHSLGS
jgi:hypothetical protein